jgi:hypothetical protein
VRAWFAALLCLWGSGCNLVFGLDAPVPAAIDASLDAAPLGPFDEPRPVFITAGVIENDAILTADGR